MNQFQQELQSLNLNDYQTGNVVYWDQQQSQYPYYYIQDDARRCGGCGGCGGRCGGCGGRCGLCRSLRRMHRMRWMFRLL